MGSKKKKLSNLHLRNGIWHLRMRVPRCYSSVEIKNEIHRSLRTGDLDEAIARFGVVKKKILTELQARLDGAGNIPTNQFEAMAKLAESRGFSYRTTDELVADGPGAVLERVLHLKEFGDATTSAAATALLGGIERPKLKITEVAEKMEEWYPENIKNKAAKARKTWKAQWTRPASKLVNILGRDPIFDEISRSDAVQLRDALKESVLDGDMLGMSAQKELRLLNTLWERFHDHLGVDVRDMPQSPFFNLGKGLGALDEEDRRKLEVPIEIISSKIIPPGKLDFMNEQLRDITYVLVETGARQSEITDIPPHSIFLDHAIPHIWIRKETGEWAREIKNKPSKRKIPLVGVALEAFQRHPEGFPRYRHKGTYSAAANKALHDNNILPKNITIGGLRHAFETRMLNIDLINDKRAAMMGHSLKKVRGREVYGDEMPLEEKLDIHQRIMFTPRVT